MHVQIDDIKRLMTVSDILSQTNLDLTQSLPELDNNFRKILDIDFIAFALWNKRAKKYHRSICSGRDNAITIAYEGYFQFQDPFRHVRTSRPNKATCLSRMINRDSLKKTPYYNEHLRRFGLEDCVEVGLYSAGDYIGDMRLWRGKSKEPFGVLQENMIDLIVPYLLKAFPRAWPSVLPVETLSNERSSIENQYRLTKREAEVLSLIMVGQSDKEVARNLDISYWTVRSHVNSLLRKTGNTSRTGLVGNFINRDPVNLPY